MATSRRLSATDERWIREKAAEIVELGVEEPPQEFLTALALAASALISAYWEPDERSNCLEMHLANVRSLVTAIRAKEAQ
jgi:hypothetical protein